MANDITFEGMLTVTHHAYTIIIIKIEWLALSRIAFEWADSYDAKVCTENYNFVSNYHGAKSMLTEPSNLIVWRQFLHQS
jgi:hypothetical protein